MTLISFCNVMVQHKKKNRAWETVRCPSNWALRVATDIVEQEGARVIQIVGEDPFCSLLFSTPGRGSDSGAMEGE